MQANFGEQYATRASPVRPRQVVLTDDGTVPFEAHRSRARVALAFTRNRMG
jgi:hypothetical protein